MPQSVRARVIVEPVAWSAAPAEAAAALVDRSGLVLLDSADSQGPWGRHSVLAVKPLRTITAPRGELVDSADLLGGGSFTDQLREMLDWVRADATADCAYAPGWLGYLGYELGRRFERLPGRARRDTSLGDLHLGFYDAVAVYDHAERRWRIARLEFDRPPGGAGRAAELLREALAGAASGAPAQDAPSACAPDPFAAPAGLASNFKADEYRAAVARCIEYIAAGDIFQVNLSQRFTRSAAAAPWAIYRRLRRHNPAWFGGYLGGDGWAVLSSSPELFLQCRGGRVVTRPIKGTRRRTGEASADQAAAAELWASPKDNAELAMIIDLLRNDLGRVCGYGSVRVVEPRRLEAHPTVFHLVGTVEGRLAAGRDRADLVAATFPGGSITGAPKIRAMEIIDELEPCARGVYTGSLAHFGVDGSAALSIAIRTAVWDRGTIHVQAGGGIVADSTPDGEYRETLDKARAVLAAVDEAEQAQADSAGD